MKTIDAYSHFAFKEVMDFIEEKTGRKHPFSKLFKKNPTLIDENARIKTMDELGADINIVIPLPELGLTPEIEKNEELCLETAKICNDKMYELVSKYPDRFRGIAMIPTTNSEIMVKELERCIKELGFVGASMGTSSFGVPADSQKFEPLYEACERLDIPIYLHPGFPGSQPDYREETGGSKYQYFQAYQWLNDSTLAMHRIVFSGIFERYPNLKVIIHHHGAMIPFFAGRVDPGIAFFERNAGIKYDAAVKPPYIEHYKKFYIDTATQCYNSKVLQIAVDFFGVDHVLFGTDLPMDATEGKYFYDGALKSVMDLDISEKDKEKLLNKNAIDMFKLK